MADVSIPARIERRLPEFAPGATLARTWPLAGGISANMVAFKLRLPDGQGKTLIARQPSTNKFQIDPKVAAEEFRVLTAVYAAGIPAPKPVYLDAPTGDAPEPFFIVEYIEGRPEVDPQDSDAYLDRYARRLASIHQMELGQSELDFLPRQDHGFGPRPVALNDSLREGEIRDALESVGSAPRTATVLRHGDFWPGNVLWRDGEIVGIVDWEEALLGEPLADLAICRLDLWWVLGRDAALDFTRRYQALTGIDLKGLPYWDLCASLRPITNLHEWAPSYPDLGRPDITVATMTRDHQAFADEALRGMAGPPMRVSGSLPE